MKYFCFLIGLLFFYSSAAQAEYRAYLLQIVNADGQPEKTVTSTLDHYQYVDYYPLNPGSRVIYLDSWMCQGNTSQYKKICNKPEVQEFPAEGQDLPTLEGQNQES